MPLWILATLIFPLSLLADEALKVPSSLTLTVGGDRQHSINSALDGTISTSQGWLFFAGVESSKIPDADQGDDLVTSGASLGVGTNPLKLFSGELSYHSWRMADDLFANGAELGLTFAPETFTLRLQLGSEKLEFRNLPVLLFSNRESVVHDNYGALSFEYYLGLNWSVRTFYSKHQYSEDLNRYVSQYALLVSRTPASVLTTVTAFPDQDGGIEGGFDSEKFSVHGELASSRSALDHVRTRRVRLMGSYKLSENWRTGLELGTSKPEKSEEDPRDNRFGSASLTFSWK